MLKDIVSHMDLYGMAETATILFLGVFVMVAVVTLLRPKKGVQEAASLPNEELPRV